MPELCVGVQIELPKYKCHKEVRAAKVLSVRTDSLVVEIKDHVGIVPVDSDYLNKHKPEIGGYYVQYEDGYESWSPAKAFESGYSYLME